MKTRVAVIGAGFFGGMIAETLSRRGYEVDLFERNAGVMQGASRHNHNRIHLGYHYLRSIETAQQSIEGLDSFTAVFGDAILTEFPNFYCIAAEGSHTSPDRFEEFCRVVNIDFESAYPDEQWLARDRIAACYRVPEPVFDFPTASRILAERVDSSTVRAHFGTPVEDLRVAGSGYDLKAEGKWQGFDVVINATYDAVNTFNRMLGVPPRTYLYEDVLIPVFRYEAPPIGLTVMDGEFCSVMPRGTRENEFLLYHVRDSVLRRRLDQEGFGAPMTVEDDAELFAESSVYMPFLRGCRSFDRYRSIRIVWENDDDARRTVLYNDLPNYYSLLSGKVTTCVDLAAELADELDTHHG